MITNEFTLAIEDLMRESARRDRRYQALRWRNVHTLALTPGSERIVFGLAAKRWLPSPSKSCLAEMADWAEERGDEAFVHEIAAAIQRIATSDPICKAHFLNLASTIEDLGRIEKGCADQALRAELDLERLLSAEGKWSTLEEVLGESHSFAMDLIILAWRRLATQPERWWEILTIIYRLRSSYRVSLRLNPEYSRDDCQTLIHLHSSLERMLMRDWFHSSGLRREELPSWAWSFGGGTDGKGR